MIEKYMDDLDMKLFYEDSYMTEFEAYVISCEAEGEGRYKVVLDQTAFFPEGGGQYADTGVLGDVNVLDVQENEDVIYHITDGPVEVQSIVTGKINFEERYDRMQQHTGEHIVSGLVNRIFGYDNVGFHLGNDIVTMDFNGDISYEELREIEAAANEAVYSNAVVETRFISGDLKDFEYRSKLVIDGLVRVVIIPGYDACACCAPHVLTTGEVGMIRLTDVQKYKGGVRVFMLCGKRALKDYINKEKSVKDISVMLSAKPDEVVTAVEKLREQVNSHKMKISSLMNLYLDNVIKEINPQEKVVSLWEESLEANHMRNFVNSAMEINENLCCAFSGNDEDGYSYIIGSKTVDVAALVKEMNTQLNGKGGGKVPMVQGSVKAAKSEIMKFLEGRD